MDTFLDSGKNKAAKGKMGSAFYMLSPKYSWPSSPNVPYGYKAMRNCLHLVFSGSNTDGSFTIAISNSFLSHLEKVL